MKILKRLLKALFAIRLFAPPPQPRFRSGQESPFRVPGRTVFVGDEEFIVREMGDGHLPPLVLVHGLGGSSAAEWYQVAPRLAEDFRVIMIDQRNHGQGPPHIGRSEISDLAEDLAGVLDVIGIRSAHFAGYSMGGAICQQFYHLHPGRVRSLTLIATLDHHRPWWRRWRTVGIWLARAWERLTGLGAPEVRAGYLLGTGAVKPEHARWLWIESHRRNADGGADASWSLFRFDGRGWLERTSPPTTAVIAVYDQLVPSAWQYQLAARIRDVEVVELEGRHELPWTHPEAVADAIADTARRTPAQP